ncbi:MAG: hypothetical protein U0169_14165 [Polyangiaceae bacterium]
MLRTALLLGAVVLTAACSSAPAGDLEGDDTEDAKEASGRATAGEQGAGATAGGFAGGDAGASSASASCSTGGATRECFPFASGKAGVGICKAGTETCTKRGEFGDWGSCSGAVGPGTEVCGDGLDNDCNGVVDDGCAKDGGVDAPAPGQPVSGVLEFHHLPDTARWTNCLKVQVNGGPETDLGCNKGAPLLSANVVVNAPPACNVVRLNLYSNGKFNKSTSNPADVAKSFVIQKLGPGNFSVKCNDNGDNDFNDLNLTMNAKDGVLFTIENTGIACN